MMTPFAPWLELLLLASLKGSILLVAALGATRLMRRASAESRHAVLTLGLAAFFLLPIAGIVAPRWTVPAVPTDVIGLAGDRILESPAPSVPDAVRPAEPRANAGGAASDESTASTMTQSGPSTLRFRDRIDWPLALGGLWILGTLAVVIRLLVGITKLRTLSRRATMVTDGGWLQTAHALARRLGLTRGVTLLRGDRESVPMTWGVLSPVVWLPPTADHWPAELRSAVLSHELAHVRRRDAMTQWLANAVVAVHWFNPLVWITAGALRAERERACDDAVLALGVEADDYAAQLLDMVRTLGSSGGPATAMAMARRSQFEGRLLAILDRTISRAPVGSARVAGLAAMAVVLVLALAGMRGASASDEVRTTLAAAPITLPPLRVAATPIITPRPSQPQSSTDRAMKAPLSAGRDLSADVRAKTDASAPEGATTSQVPDRQLLGTEAVSGPTPAPVIPTAPVALLNALQSATRRDTTLMLEIIAAAEGISGSSDRVAVLERMARRPNLEPEVVAALGSAAGRVSSTTERSKLLRALIQNQPHAIGASRRPVLAAIGGVTSSSDLAALLMAYITKPNLSDSALADALATSERISTSTDKARVLIGAARIRKVEGAVRASYLKSARTITNDSDRARALTALVDGPGNAETGPAPGAPPRVIGAAAGTASPPSLVRPPTSAPAGSRPPR